MKAILSWFRFPAWTVHAVVGLFVFVNCVFANCTNNPDKVPAVLTFHG